MKKDFEKSVSMRKSHKLKNKSLSVNEKLILRICMVLIIIIISILCFSNRAYKVIEESSNEISKASKQITEQISMMDEDLITIEKKIEDYTRTIDTVKSLTQIEQNSQSSRVIEKNSIPDMLSKIKSFIPKEVKIISVNNVNDSKKILIEAESEKYEQLGYFSSVLKSENVLKNIKSTSGSKTGNVVKITIEGELP